MAASMRHADSARAGIFEVTEGRILPLPIINSSRSLVKRYLKESGDIVTALFCLNTKEGRCILRVKAQLKFSVRVDRHLWRGNGEEREIS